MIIIIFCFYFSVIFCNYGILTLFSPFILSSIVFENSYIKTIFLELSLSKSHCLFMAYCLFKLCIKGTLA
jgi:hypothetical protein